MKSRAKTYQEVISTFLAQSNHIQYYGLGAVFGANKSKYRLGTENNVLYSYGSVGSVNNHYKLAFFVGDTLVINSDRYSKTTNKQRYILMNSIRPDTKYVSWNLQNNDVYNYEQLISKGSLSDKINNTVTFLKDLEVAYQLGITNSYLTARNKAEIYLNSIAEKLNKLIDEEQYFKAEKLAENTKAAYGINLSITDSIDLLIQEGYLDSMSHYVIA